MGGVVIHRNLDIKTNTEISLTRGFRRSMHYRLISELMVGLSLKG